MTSTERAAQAKRKRDVALLMVRAANNPLSPEELARLAEDDQAVVKDMRSYAASLGLPESDGDWFWRKMMRDDWRFAGVPVDNWKRTMTIFFEHQFFKSQRAA